jgi:hypothetical protein
MTLPTILVLAGGGAGAGCLYAHAVRTAARGCWRAWRLGLLEPLSRR